MFRFILQRLLARKPSSARPAYRPGLGVELLEGRVMPASTTYLTVGASEQFATITAAVADAAAISPHGGKNIIIEVYPGTYNEAVTIATPNIGIEAMNGAGTVTVQPTSVTATTLGPSHVNVGGAAIEIESTGITINGLTVDGSQVTQGQLWAGIRVLKGGSATIMNTTVTGITTSPVQGTNVAIQVGTSLVSTTAGAGSATIENNTIEDYTSAGVMVDGRYARAVVKDNTITGMGPNVGGAENGVQVSNEAVAAVSGNTITENTLQGYQAGGYNPPSTSAGILFYNDAFTSSSAVGNTVSENDDGILVSSSNGLGRPIVIKANYATDNYGYGGIVLESSNGTVVTMNVVTNNSTYNGIAINNSGNVKVTDNTVQSNVNADGIYDYIGLENTIAGNISTNNGNNGINIQQSVGDVVNSNILFDNQYYGISLAIDRNTTINNNLVESDDLGTIYTDATSTGTKEHNNTT